MTGKEIVKLIVTLVIGFILSSAFDHYKSIQSNNDSILVSNEKLEQFDKRITKLEDDNRKLGDIYVTRREFTVIVDNLNTTLKRVDDNILKLTEKFYESQGKK
ncbi:MAG: hypothetical protein IAA47_02990 [Candidatus Fusobacterium pullicola]|uniref:Uncharacterized protein n=1 Tax=Candidatus Fusobacterium pullicola TaxID=2838601 RepID=A0A9E2KYX7_9FUSO|nr:hypothetical protein [Candidatus Fusobacterium pullicola]